MRNTPHELHTVPLNKSCRLPVRQIQHVFPHLVSATRNPPCNEIKMDHSRDSFISFYRLHMDNYTMQCA